VTIIKENPMTACAYLLWKIAELVPIGANVDPGRLNFAIYDIGTKAKQLDASFRRSIFDRVEKALSNTRTQPVAIEAIGWLRTYLFGDEITHSGAIMGPAQERVKPRADVAIVTVINEERKAVRKIFGVDHAPSIFDIDGREFYVSSLTGRGAGKREINIYITMVGEPRNVPCANVCRDIIERLNVDLLILCGIAGGNRDRKVALAHVVAPYSIFYIEGGKSHIYTRFLRKLYGLFGGRTDSIFSFFGYLLGQERFTEPEIITKNMLDPAKAYLQNFEPENGEAVRLCQATLASYSLDEIPLGATMTSADYECHRTNAMCGEKVLVDDGLRKMSQDVNRKIYAVDMESYGFAAACEHSHKPWIVFRGISDYADPKKDDSRHIAASVAAAATAHLFLRHAYKLPEERPEF